MKHVGETIHRIIEEKRLVKKQVADLAGMDPSYLGQIRTRESLDAEMLEKLCKAVGISPAYFFDDWPSDKYTIGDITNSSFMGPATINVGNSTEYVDKLLAEKDRVIAAKEEIISLMRMGLKTQNSPEFVDEL